MSAAAPLIPVGIAIGVLLGAVGGGGSLLAVPALVYIGDQSVPGAQAGALVVVVIASAVGLSAYLRRGEVRWRAGLAFGAAAALSSLLGSLASRMVDPDLLLLLFAGVMLLGAAAMVRGGAAGHSHFRPWRLGVSVESALKVSGSGLALGLLIGFFGVGGGFVIVPVLALGLRFSITEAVGTSLLVVVIGSLAALVARLQDGGLEWAVVLPFAAAAALGVLAGSRLGRHLPAQVLSRGLAALIVAVAFYTGGRALSALG